MSGALDSLARTRQSIVASGVVVCALLFLVSGPVATGVAAAPSPPFTQCPAIGADSGCGLLIDVTNSGTSVLKDPGLGPYDGEDDTLVGVLNQSGAPITELPLTSSEDIFGFDGDGICQSPYNVFSAGCPFGPTGYEGPGTSFVASSPTSGHVGFNPAIPPGGSAYFALEEAIEAAQLIAGPPTVQITSGPPVETSSQSAAFAFTGVAGGTYECKIDNGPWTPCSSGQTFSPVMPGDHLFQVRETLGNLVGPAATYQWTVALPRACVLRVARARVFVFTHHHKIRLVIHYTSYEPAEVNVSYRLGGSAGGLFLGSATRHFHLSGVFRLPEALRPAENRNVSAAKSMKVTFRIKGTPGYCGRYYTKRLTIPKKIFGQTVWFQSDSRFGPVTE